MRYFISGLLDRHVIPADKPMELLDHIQDLAVVRNQGLVAHVLGSSIFLTPPGTSVIDVDNSCRYELLGDIYLWMIPANARRPS